MGRVTGPRRGPISYWDTASLGGKGELLGSINHDVTKREQSVLEAQTHSKEFLGSLERNHLLASKC